LEAIFDTKQIVDRTYSVKDLCRAIYGQDEKRHRVAVLRGIKGIIKRNPWIGQFYSSEECCFCDCRSLHAYAVMMRRYHNDSHEKAEQRLRYDLEHPGPFSTTKENMTPETGLWWLYCELAKAKWWTYDQARAKKLEARYEAASKKDQALRGAQMASLRAQISRRPGTNYSPHSSPAIIWRKSA
jgi:hypothetical protein